MENQPTLSKKEANKLKKKEAVKSKKIAEKGDQTREIEEDISVGLYGMKELVNEKFTRIHKLVSIKDINETQANETITVKGYLHQVRKTGKQAFLVLRYKMSSIQCIAYVGEKISKQMLQFIGNIPKESVVEIEGDVRLVDKPVESCTQSNVEIHLNKIFIVSKALSRLPLQIEDCMRPENVAEGLAKVNLDTRLDNRVLDLRTPTNIAINVIKDSVKWYFSSYLREHGFINIETPGLISAASEGGANVFEVTYFNEKAYLAQSPQLYKQMAIVSGFDKVYVIGPVFRAENSNTHRHLTEFTGLDLEMTFDIHYHEVLDVICETMVHIFKNLESNLASEIAIVNKQFEAEPFVFLEPTLVLEFSEGVEMLRSAGIEMGDFEDLTTTNEKILGKLVKKKFGTDFYVLDRFPSSVRPFYTMPDPEDARYSNSYDMFMRGEEILSGAQRIHDATMLRASAEKHGINLQTIKDYLESFEMGCLPHAGGGIGLERVVMLYLGLDNIRRVSMFPRDPRRLRP